MSDCFFVILRLNPACPELASLRIRLAKAVVLPCNLDPVLLSFEPDPNAVTSDPDRVILRLNSPTDRRSRRWNARSALLSRVMESSSKSMESSLGMELTEDERPTRGNGMSDCRFEGESTTSGLKSLSFGLNTTDLVYCRLMEHCMD